jgi:hypothetical protein
MIRPASKSPLPQAGWSGLRGCSPLPWVGWSGPGSDDPTYKPETFYCLSDDPTPWPDDPALGILESFSCLKWVLGRMIRP